MEDAALRAELLDSEKERAEHVMVVDLERNDLGRVCVPGSVRVDPFYRVETTSYCHQAVSSVRGLLRPDVSVGELLEATFPCGSITGAPKIAAMSIAGRLEPVPRGAYTGSLVIAVPGEVDSAVLIRTAEVTPCDTEVATEGTTIRYGAGCGITVESDPLAEWEESVLKSEPVLGVAVTTAAPAVALKETCRIARGTVPLWPYHRERLASGGCGDELLDAIDARVADAAALWAGAPTRRARLTEIGRAHV